VLRVTEWSEASMKQAGAELNAEETSAESAEEGKGPYLLAPGHSLLVPAEEGSNAVFGRVDPADKGEDNGMGWRGSPAAAAEKGAHRMGFSDCCGAQR
jgi:hypothetical protein